MERERDTLIHGQEEESNVSLLRSALRQAYSDDTSTPTLPVPSPPISSSIPTANRQQVGDAANPTAELDGPAERTRWLSESFHSMDLGEIPSLQPSEAHEEVSPLHSSSYCFPPKNASSSSTSSCASPLTSSSSTVEVDTTASTPLLSCMDSSLSEKASRREQQATQQDAPQDTLRDKQEAEPEPQETRKHSSSSTSNIATTTITTMATAQLHSNHDNRLVHSRSPQQSQGARSRVTATRSTAATAATATATATATAAAAFASRLNKHPSQARSRSRSRSIVDRSGSRSRSQSPTGRTRSGTTPQLRSHSPHSRAHTPAHPHEAYAHRHRARSPIGRRSSSPTARQLSSAPLPADAREIRLLSYNLNILPKGSSLMSAVGHRFKNARFAEFVPTLVEGTYDVLALQEVFSSPFFPIGCFQQQLLSVAQRCGYTYVVRSPRPSWRDLLGAKKWTDSGLLILSRLPFLDQGFHTFRNAGSDVDSNASKGVVYAKIQVGDSSLLLFNCHLQATHTSNTRASFLPAHQGYQSIRQAQLRELCQFMHETCHKHHNDSSWMLTGDFNIDAIAEPAVVDVLGPVYDDHNEETEEYLQLMAELNRLPFPSNVRDLLKESYGGHPPTRPPREEFPRKIAGIFRHKYPQRLDYVFWMNMDQRVLRVQSDFPAASSAADHASTTVSNNSSSSNDGPTRDRNPHTHGHIGRRNRSASALSLSHSSSDSSSSSSNHLVYDPAPTPPAAIAASNQHERHSSCALDTDARVLSVKRSASSSNGFGGIGGGRVRSRSDVRLHGERPSLTADLLTKNGSSLALRKTVMSMESNMRRSWNPSNVWQDRGRLYVKHHSTEVVPFACNNHNFTHISDHYALETTLVHIPHDASGVAKPCFSGKAAREAKRRDRITKLKSRISSSSRLYVEVVRSFATYWRKTTLLLLLLWVALTSLGYFHYFFVLLFATVLVYLTFRAAQSAPQYYRKYSQRRLQSLQRSHQQGRPGLGYDPVRAVGRVRVSPKASAAHSKSSSSIQSATAAATVVQGNTPYEQLRQAVYRFGYRPCLGTPSSSHTYSWITYDALYRRVCYFGSGLCNLDIAQGSRVGLVCRSSADAVVVVKACQTFGWVLVPLYDAERTFLYRSAKHAEVSVVVCDRATTLRIAKLLKGLPHLRFVIQTNRIEYEETKAVSKLNSGTKLIPMDFLEKDGRVHPHRTRPPASSDVCCIQYDTTSGGELKAVLHTHGNVAAGSTSVLAVFPERR